MLSAKDIINALMESGACVAGCCEASDELYIGENRGYKSIFCGAFPYLSEDDSNGRMANYSLGLDYHEVLKSRIQSKLPGFDVFADVSPFNEIRVAETCGIGKRGKNNHIAVDGYGTYVFLACIGADVEADVITESTVPDCKNCNACVNACPTNALYVNNGEVKYNVDRCLSNISQKKGELTDDELNALHENNIVWGCDRCQDACPKNIGAKLTYIQEFLEHPHYPTTSAELEDMSNKEFRRIYKNRAFSWRGVAVLRRNLKNLE